MKRLLLAMVATVPLLTGCTTRPVAPNLPAAFETVGTPPAAASQASEGLDSWWDLYADPELKALVTEALATAPDARAAAARLDEARAVRASALSAFNPLGNLRGQTGKTETDQISGGSPLLTADGETRNANAGFDVSWELDLFGRRRATRQKANADLIAARFDAEGSRASLAAGVAQQVFQVRGFGIQLEDAQQTVRIQRSLASTAQTRAERGLGASADTERVKADLAQSLAEEARLKAELQAARRSLLVLVGRGSDPTADLAVTSGLGPVPEVPATLPSELMTRRPDVRQAQARLTAALGQRRLSRLALFPTFTLLPGTGWSDIQTPVYGSTTSFWSLSAGLSMPILDLPRLLQQIKVQDARTRQAAIAYEKTVQTAFGETESTLVRLAADRTRVQLLTGGEASARVAYDAAEKKYAAGLIDLTSALDAERAWRASRSALTAAQVTALQRSAQAFKALGGGWPALSDTSGSHR